MPLVAQALSGLDLDRLYLEILGLSEDGVGAPRAVGTLNHPAILPDLRQDSYIHRPRRDDHPGGVCANRSDRGLWSRELVDHRGARALMPRPGHHLLTARPGGRGECPTHVSQVVEVQAGNACPIARGVPDRPEVGPAQRGALWTGEDKARSPAG